MRSRISSDSPRIIARIRPLMQGTRDIVVAAERVGVVVAPAFHDVDLAARGPRTMGVYGRHYP